MCVQAVNKDWDEEVCLHSTSGWHPAYLCIVMAHEISPGLGLNAALSGLECGPYGSHILLHGTSWLTSLRRLGVSQVQDLCLMWISCPRFTPLTLTSIYLRICRTFLEDHPGNWQLWGLQGRLGLWKWGIYSSLCNLEYLTMTIM